MLAGVEESADRLLVDRLGAASLGPIPSGRERAGEPGFILVATDERDVVVGFVHVLEGEGWVHLEQVSVHPGAARRGHGRALVEAAIVEAGRRGHTELTLRTFAEVPWNVPFYASCGFVPTAPATPFELHLVEVEARLGLDRLGSRVQMTRSLVPGDPC